MGGRLARGARRSRSVGLAPKILSEISSEKQFARSSPEHGEGRAARSRFRAQQTAFRPCMHSRRRLNARQATSRRITSSRRQFPCGKPVPSQGTFPSRGTLSRGRRNLVRTRKIRNALVRRRGVAGTVECKTKAYFGGRVEIVKHSGGKIAENYFSRRRFISCNSRGARSDPGFPASKIKDAPDRRLPSTCADEPMRAVDGEPRPAALARRMRRRGPRPHRRRP